MVPRHRLSPARLRRLRPPLLPTLVVAAAVLLMLRLGVWQLERRHEKQAAVAQYAANLDRPPAAFAALWPVAEADLFRRASVTCVAAGGWTAQAGHDTRGQSGWRHLATCRTGAEGPGLLVDMGVSDRAAAPRWAGGAVRGRLIWAPTGEPLVARLFRAAPAPTPLIVSEAAAPGLRPTAQPDPAEVPNNHLSYAVQWFAFAAVAVAIYLLALLRRARAG